MSGLRDGVPSSVIIVGAGIGGLTAALALAAGGRQVTIVERRTGFSEVGAGIQLSPNASRILSDLGLGPAVRRAATEPDRVRIRAMASGREIGAVALGAFMRQEFEAPYLVIHRADLQTLLLDAVRSNPGVRLLMGREAVAAENGREGATLTLDKAGGGRETLVSDLVVGADGVRSRLRLAVGDRRAPVASGAVAWRATVPRDLLPVEFSGNETGLWLGGRGHVVHYPIAGGRLLNIVAIEAHAAKTVEGWSAAGERSDLLERFRRAAAPLRDLLALAPDWLLWPLLELPAKRMARGRIALLGDAAHPVLPFLAQGGALAIEDAAALAASLAGDGPVETRLSAYARARLGRVRRVQAHARRNGRVYHASGPVALARNLAMRRLGPEGMVRRYAWVYGWTPPG